MDVKQKRLRDILAAGASNLVYEVVPSQAGTLVTLGDYEVHIESILTNGSLQCAVFIIHSHDCAFITFRGTQSFADWKVNIKTSRINFLDGNPGNSGKADIRVHEGYYRSYLEPTVVKDKSGGSGCVLFTPSIHDQVLGAIDRLSETHAYVKHLVFTGHSLGGALATLSLASVCGLDKYTAIINKHNTALVTFGSPRIGCPSFAQLVMGFNAKIRRYVTLSKAGKRDIVSTVPSTTHRSLSKTTFMHVGEELIVPSTETAWFWIHSILTYIKQLKYMFSMEHINVESGFELLDSDVATDPAIDSIFMEGSEMKDRTEVSDEERKLCERNVTNNVTSSQTIECEETTITVTEKKTTSATRTCTTTTTTSVSSSRTTSNERRHSLYSNLLQEVRILDMIYHEKKELGSEE